LTKDPETQGVLRSALWSHRVKQPGSSRGPPRPSGRQRFIFRGGLLLISKPPARRTAAGTASAWRPRIEVIAWRSPTPKLGGDECANWRGKDTALDGRSASGPEKNASRSMEYLLKGRCRAAGCPLDLRLQQKAVQATYSSRRTAPSRHWEDLVAGQRPGSVLPLPLSRTHTSPEPGRQARNVIREMIGNEADSKKQEQLHMQKTGASRATSSVGSAKWRAESSTTHDQA